MNEAIRTPADELEREIASLRRQLDDLRRDPGDLPVSGCGNNPCDVQSPTGMATQGRCRCDESTLRRALRYWRRRAAFLEHTIVDRHHTPHEYAIDALENKQPMGDVRFLDVHRACASLRYGSVAERVHELGTSLSG